MMNLHFDQSFKINQEENNKFTFKIAKSHSSNQVLEISFGISLIKGSTMYLGKKGWFKMGKFVKLNGSSQREPVKKMPSNGCSQKAAVKKYSQKDTVKRLQSKDTVKRYSQKVTVKKLQSKHCSQRAAVKRLQSKGYSQKATVKRLQSKDAVKQLQPKSCSQKATVKRLQSKGYSQKATVKRLQSKGYCQKDTVKRLPTKRLKRDAQTNHSVYNKGIPMAFKTRMHSGVKFSEHSDKVFCSALWLL